MAAVIKYIKIDGIKACVLWIVNRMGGDFGVTFEMIQTKVGKSPVISAIAELLDAGHITHPVTKSGDPITTKFQTTAHGVSQLRRNYRVAIESIDAQLKRVGEVGHPKSEVERLEQQRAMVEEARAVLTPIEEAPEAMEEQPRKLHATIEIPAEEMPRGPKPAEPLTEGLMSGKGPTKRVPSASAGA